MKVLLLGGAGMLGTDLATVAPAEITVVAPSRRELDVTDHAALARALDALRPEWVVNAAAYTLVDRAEIDVADAFAVNAHAVGAMGRACAARSVRVVHFSTDYVFDGSRGRAYVESDAVDPINSYGRSKLAGEVELRESGAPALTLRTQWLFGVHGRSFPRTMWQRAMQRLPTSVVDDQFGAPTFTVDLARATWGLVTLGALGLYHVVNRGVTTWHGVAEHVFEIAGVPALLSRSSTANYPTPARRPAYSALDTSKLERDTRIVLPDWTDALDRFLVALRAEPAA